MPKFVTADLTKNIKKGVTKERDQPAYWRAFCGTPVVPMCGHTHVRHADVLPLMGYVRRVRGPMAHGPWRVPRGAGAAIQ